MTAALAVGVGLLSGCTSQPTATPSAAATLSAAAHCECLVCKHNADLACVDVAVDTTTPRAVYQGRTYYFCSAECRAEFLKNPAKYAALAK